ncbi:UTP:RNA uridylyltransferase 1 [Magnolia sinica]|uniref:UTP:RNA uridylyltransferase 1 n=1 Tax=Magnolia sinica TaxID=86752 RepID=UPI002657F750|nr:UTP:RNA uridylyltransferase 1 [Magnolia sinica]
MARGGGRPPQPAPDPAPSSGHFLLQLLQKHPSSSPPSPSNSISPHHHDPAVAAVGPSHPFPPWPTDPSPRPDPAPPPLFPQSHFPFLPPHAFSNLPWPLPSGFPPPSISPINALDFPNSHFSANPPFFPDALQHPPGFPPQHRPGPPHHLLHQDRIPAVDKTLTFGSLKCEFLNHDGLPNGNSVSSGGSKTHTRYGSEQSSGGSSSSSKGSSVQAPEPVHSGHERGRGGPGLKQPRGTFQRVSGEPCRPKGPGQWVAMNERRDGERGLEKADEPLLRQPVKNLVHYGNVLSKLPLSVQIDDPGPSTGSSLHSVPAADIEESLANLQGEHAGKRGPAQQRLEKMSDREGEISSEQLKGTLMIKDELGGKNSVRQYNDSARKKDHRSEFSRGLQVPNHRMRNRFKGIECRSDIERLSPYFLSIYESLIPPEEEKAKQKQLLASLEKLVNKEWPSAQLYLYGSCANSFGVSNSDIDVCLAIDDDDISKPDILLKLADILQSDNLQNVQALTRARVPIVKLMDPITEISCDICINNVLAVVNTKLLRDYAQIDARLQQLAFIVKHWAKSRGVNETYRGTLSSYAYVLMCIHFLQLRKPAILPCLQEMKATYVVTVDDIECAYFDQVEDLRDFGAQNRESIARLLWAFFDYWAYRHDYANAVISVRTGSIISKRAKEWTTRVGNDRHLICIEDPFEINHDLGRVVDKHSIKTLRVEFERAANILQYDPNPNVTLFELYVPD